MLRKERQVLVIFPHPDDEAFGVSGTIATYRKLGVPVTYACLTLGEMGRNFGNPPFANRETLPQVRKAELQKACEEMGIEDLRMMGLRDKTIEFEDDEKMIQLVTDLVEELQPSLIITFYPGLAVHPDHDATGRAVVSALGQMAQDQRPTLYTIAFSHDAIDTIGEPDILHDVAAVVDKKIATLNAHASQTVWLMKEMQQKYDEQDPEAINFFHNERFYTYNFQE